MFGLDGHIEPHCNTVIESFYRLEHLILTSGAWIERRRAASDLLGQEEFYRGHQAGGGTRLLIPGDLPCAFTALPGADGPGHFYGTIHLDLARDPQTILAYEMNGEPLPIAHGAPLRLRVETQLGFMMIKYIQRIELVADYRSVGQGQGGWREDYQFYSPEAGI